jgi:hypothetical protein
MLFPKSVTSSMCSAFMILLDLAAVDLALLRPVWYVLEGNVRASAQLLLRPPQPVKSVST